MNPEESPIPESMDTDVWGEATPNPRDEQAENLLLNSVVETASPNPLAENPINDVTTESQVQVVELQDQSPSIEDLLYTDAAQRVRELKQEEANLKIEIAQLQATYKNLQTQINTTQTNLSNIVQESLAQLEQRKQALQISVEQLERRQERIRNEMRTTFAGASQDLAIRVQGFKDYLAGSLQDLAAAAEQLQLVPAVREREKPPVKELVVKVAEPEQNLPQITPQQFQDTSKQIRRLIDQYRNQPDYYGPPWQLRRTFEPVHAERVSNWFFNLGGRGAMRTMGSRLQNILVGSAAISILHKLYGDRLRTLILANTPERLGEWRRGLQDCLGIGRPDFGPDRGVTLFEAPAALAQRADRLTKANQMPLIIIDDSEEQISLALLQFPLWLAFAPDPKTMRDRDFDDDF